ncbi:MAG: 30S ribosomal protein S18 [Campylobacter sp.]
MAEKKKFARKYCRYTEAKIEYIDYKDTQLLKYCLSERFKIMPRRLTGTSKKYQEMLEQAIKRARHVALIPYVINGDEVVVNPFENL